MKTPSKHPRLRLDPESYKKLCQQVLERDGWRCQSCGSTGKLQIHHKELRSHSGSDSEENLITLCNRCHELVHRRRILDTVSLGDHRLRGFTDKK